MNIGEIPVQYFSLAITILAAVQMIVSGVGIGVSIWLSRRRKGE